MSYTNLMMMNPKMTSDLILSTNNSDSFWDKCCDDSGCFAINTNNNNNNLSKQSENNKVEHSQCGDDCHNHHGFDNAVVSSNKDIENEEFEQFLTCCFDESHMKKNGSNNNNTTTNNNNDNNNSTITKSDLEFIDYCFEYCNFDDCSHNSNEHNTNNTDPVSAGKATKTKIKSNGDKLSNNTISTASTLNEDEVVDCIVMSPVCCEVNHNSTPAVNQYPTLPLLPILSSSTSSASSPFSNIPNSAAMNFYYPPNSSTSLQNNEYISDLRDSNKRFKYNSSNTSNPHHHHHLYYHDQTNSNLVHEFIVNEQQQNQNLSIPPFEDFNWINNQFPNNLIHQQGHIHFHQHQDLKKKNENLKQDQYKGEYQRKNSPRIKTHTSHKIKELNSKTDNHDSLPPHHHHVHYHPPPTAPPSSTPKTTRQPPKELESSSNNNIPATSPNHHHHLLVHRHQHLNPRHSQKHQQLTSGQETTNKLERDRKEDKSHNKRIKVEKPEERNDYNTTSESPSSDTDSKSTTTSSKTTPISPTEPINIVPCSFGDCKDNKNTDDHVFKFSTNSELVEHLVGYHDILKTSYLKKKQNQLKTGDFNSVSEYELPQYLCLWGDCGFVTSELDNFLKHFPSSHGFKKDGSLAPFALFPNVKEEKEKDIHKATALLPNGKYQCCWVDDNDKNKCCEEVFESTKDLTDHLIDCHVKSGKSQYCCNWKDCNRGIASPFTQRQKIIRHLHVHTLHKPFECDQCHKTFSLELMLEQHKRVHTGETPFVCDICEKGFKTSSSLSIHHRTHTGFKPLECDVCGKKFNESSNLTKHMKIHSRPFKCELCFKTFTNGSKLENHLKKFH